MNVKKCTVEERPEPPPPDPCKVQRIEQKLKAGITLCPAPPEEEIPPIPPCIALCSERIKNPPVDLGTKFVPICRHTRVETEQPVPCSHKLRFNKDKKEVCKK